MTDLFSYTPPRRSADTSRLALDALNKKDRRAHLEAIAYAAIREAGPRGLTSFELAHVTGEPFESIQPRTTGLRDAGKIKDSGDRRPSPRGRKAIVWVLDRNGRDELAAQRQWRTL